MKRERWLPLSSKSDDKVQDKVIKLSQNNETNLFLKVVTVRWNNQIKACIKMGIIGDEGCFMKYLSNPPNNNFRKSRQTTFLVDRKPF